jgi:hypothetical protein
MTFKLLFRITIQTGFQSQKGHTCCDIPHTASPILDVRQFIRHYHLGRSKAQQMAHFVLTNRLSARRRPRGRSSFADGRGVECGIDGMMCRRS